MTKSQYITIIYGSLTDTEFVNRTIAQKQDSKPTKWIGIIRQIIKHVRKQMKTVHQWITFKGASTVK
jgi:hypothetical protein